MTLVELHDCRFFGRHGLLKHEREAGNEFAVAVSVGVADTPLPAYCDDIVDSPSGMICYADIYEICREEMATPRNLLETVARRIACRILRSWPEAESAKVEVRKLTPPIPGITGSAGVTVCHSRG